MKRDELENLIASLHRAMMCARIGRVDDMVQLCALARLGASVAEPSEEEIEAMARAAAAHLGAEYADTKHPQKMLANGKDTFDALASVALLALKDRANV